MKIAALKRVAVVVLMCAGLIVTSVLPAAAHIGLSATTTAAGSTAVLSFGFGHGCGESPTAALTIQIPESIISVQPVFAAGWDISWETEELSTPVAGPHGAETTSRTSTVTFTAEEPIPTGVYALVSLRLTIPEYAAGETIAFPVIQTCVEGEHAWIEIPAEGEDAHDLESPAPSIEITAAAGDAGH